MNLRKGLGAAGLAALLAATAAGQDEGGRKRQDRGKKEASSAPFGLPTAVVLKEKLALTDEQVAKVEALYKDAATQEAQLKKSGREGGDRKKAQEETTAARNELIAKLKEIFNDEQDKKLDELVQTPSRRKKAEK